MFLAEELKKKMYSCILIVGGGMKFVGISTWLQNKITLHIPYIYKGGDINFLVLLGRVLIWFIRCIGNFDDYKGKWPANYCVEGSWFDGNAGVGVRIMDQAPRLDRE